MPRPNFDLDLATGTFTFDNGHVTIEGHAEVVPPLTVQSVTLTNHHHTDGLALGISGVEVPPHLFDLLI
jgi:hypothetical protein